MGRAFFIADCILNVAYHLSMNFLKIGTNRLLRLRTMALVMTGAFVLNACAKPPELPSLPDIQTTDLLPAVREQLENARQAVLANPNDADANGEYALVAHAYDYSEAADTLYERARRLAPRNPRWPFYQSAVLQRMGDLDAALVALDDALALAPEHVDVMAKRGEALYLLNRVEEAEAQLQSVVDRNEHYPLAQFYLARMLLDKQQWQAAVTRYQSLLQEGLDVREVHQGLGVAYRGLGRAEDARRHLQIAARDHGLVIASYDPINMTVAKFNQGDQPHLLKAREYYYRGDLQSAENELLAALEKNPDSLGAHQHLIRIYAERKQVDNARRHYERVMALEPENPLAHASWGLALRNAGDIDGAVVAFTRAVDLDPADPKTKIALAGALGRAGRHEQALQVIDDSLELDPASRDALALRGNSLVALARYEEALETLEQARTPADNKTPMVLIGIAKAQVETGRREEAIETLTTAAEMASEYGNAALFRAITKEIELLQNAPPPG